MARHSSALSDVPPAPISFRTEAYAAGSVFPARSQPWGKIVYATSGVMEVTIEGRRFLSPPHYAIWIPADLETSCRNPRNVRYVSVCVQREHCSGFPERPCTIGLSGLIKSILADFAERRILAPSTEQDVRLALVLLDQLRFSPARESYLPLTHDALLSPILDTLQQEPDNWRSLAVWARLSGTTERTLSRRFLHELGVSFEEWRMRLKLVASLSMLEEGRSVKDVATSLGYSSPSAFIAMFQRLTGVSPTRMRMSIAS